MTKRGNRRDKSNYPKTIWRKLTVVYMLLDRHVFTYYLYICIYTVEISAVGVP